MKLFIVLTAALAAVAVIGLAVGYMLPAARTGRAERVIAAPQHVIMAVIADVEAQAEWRSDVRSIELEGERWVETTTSGERIHFAWAARDANQLTLGFESDRGYTGSWQAVFSAVPGGTQLVVEEQAVIPGPVGRLMARVLLDPAAFSRRYLDALAIRVEDVK